MLLVLSGCSLGFNPMAQPQATVTVTAPVPAEPSSPDTSASPSVATDQPTPAVEQTQPAEETAAGCLNPSIVVPSFVSPEACQAAPAAPSTPKEFVTPSGNISCRMDSIEATCSAVETQMIADLDYRKADGVCDGFYLEDQADVACHSDYPDPVSGPTVGYGQDVAVAQFVCSVEQAGVTCWNGRTGHGFFLSKAKYATW